MYKQLLIAKVIALQWFGDKKAVGIHYHKYFNPLPVQLLAFILTAVCIFKLCYFMLSSLLMPTRYSALFKNGKLVNIMSWCFKD